MNRAQRIAHDLREQPPELDDVTRARIERKVMSRSARTAEGRPTRSAVGAFAFAVAAAAVILVAYVRSGDSASRRDLSTVAQSAAGESVDSGRRMPSGHGASSLAAGVEESIRTTHSTPRDITFGKSRVSFRGDTLASWSQPSSAISRVELRAGQVSVAFHPPHVGQESFTVFTSEARVDVVGTEFTVTRNDQGTTVVVTEGVVRVSDRRDDTRVQMVRAGESASVAAVIQTAPPVTQTQPASVQTEDVTQEQVAATPSELDAEDLCARGDLLRARGDFQSALRAYRGAISRARATHDRSSLQNALYASAMMLERDLHDSTGAVDAYRRYVAAGGPALELAKRNLCRLGEQEYCGP